MCEREESVVACQASTQGEVTDQAQEHKAVHNSKTTNKQGEKN